MGKPTPASRRAALQAQREAALRAQRRGRIIGALAGAAIALALVAGLAIWWNRSHQPAPVVAGQQLAVPSASSDGAGIVVHPTPTGKPTLVIYEDYQCPWCKKAEEALGTQYQALAAKGEIGVQIRSITLLDTMSKNDSSLRANLAASCADVVGRYRPYHDAVFAAQPEKEGTGYTDQQLRTDFAATAGITGDELTRFQACYDQRQTSDAVNTVLTKAREAKKDTSSPTYWVQQGTGALKPLDIDAWLTGTAPTEAELLAAITAAA